VSKIEVLRRLIAASPFTFLPMAVKSTARFLASVSRHTPSYSAHRRSLEDEISVVYEVGRIVTSTLDIQQVYDEFAAQLKNWWILRASPWSRSIESKEPTKPNTL
jgi:hypothetical protein